MWKPAGLPRSVGCCDNAEDEVKRKTSWFEAYSHWASLGAQLVKNLPAMQGTWVQSLGWKNPLEKGTVTHSSIHGEFHGQHSPWGCKELDATEELSLYSLFSLPGGASGKGPTYQRRRHKRWGFDPWVWKISQGGFSNPHQCSCLENRMDKRSLAGYSL